MSERIRKVNSVITQELTKLIDKQVDFKPGVFATIAKVDTARDLSYTRVFVSVFPTQEHDYAMKTLEHERIGLQKMLHKKLHMKVLPKVRFHYSAVGDHVDALDEMFQDDAF